MKGKTPAPTYPSFKEAVVLLLTLFLVQLILFLLVAVIDGGFGLELSGKALTLGVINILAFALVLPRAWKRTGAPWSSVFPLGAFPLAILLPLGLVILGGSVVLSELDNLLRTLLPLSASMEAFYESLSMEEAGALGSILTLVVVAPLTEEFLFRGLILRGLLQHHSAKWAIAISALLFGLFHMNPWQFVPTAIGGLLLAWVTLETGTLWPAILIHAANNGLSSLPASFVPEIPGYSTGFSDEVSFQPLWFDSAGLIMLAIGLWLLWRVLRSNSPGPSGTASSDPLPGPEARSGGGDFS